MNIIFKNITSGTYFLFAAPFIRGEIIELKKGFQKTVTDKWMVMLLKFEFFALLKKVLMIFKINIENVNCVKIKLF